LVVLIALADLNTDNLEAPLRKVEDGGYTMITGTQSVPWALSWGHPTILLF
jgi:hypothetical protein